MINYFKIALLSMTVFISTSCQNGANEIVEPVEDCNVQKIELTSVMSDEDFLTACLSVKSQVGSISRAAMMSEIEAQQVMEPFVEDGLHLRNQIVRQVEMDPTMKVEATYFKNLSDEDCAALSFVFHSIEESDLDIKIITETLDAEQNNTKTIDTKRLLHCAAVAAGYDFVKKLSVEGIVTAVTIRQALIAIGKRYLGYVGAVLMVYDFVECIS